MNRAPKSLNASVGPWNNSRICMPGESETSFSGKLIASLPPCHNTSSGTSAPAKGLTTRKQTSVNGSRRNSWSSSGERRAISTGMYSPPSGASPRNTAPRRDVSGACRDVLRYLIRKFSSRACEPVVDHLEECLSAQGSIARNVAQLCDRQGAVGKRFVAVTPGHNQCGIAPRNGFVPGFARSRLKGTAPKDRLGIRQIALDEELLLGRRRRQIDHGHLPPQPHQQIVSRVDHTSGRIENQFLLPFLFQRGQDLVKRVNLFGEIVGFASDIAGTIWPTHPRSTAFDSSITGGGEPSCQALLDAVVTGDGGAAGRR